MDDKLIETVIQFIILGLMLFASQGLTLYLVRIWFSRVEGEQKDIKTMLAKEIQDRNDLEKKLPVTYASKKNTEDKFSLYDERLRVMETAHGCQVDFHQFFKDHGYLKNEAG